MTFSYTLNELYQYAKDEIGFSLTKTVFIRLLNRLLIDLNITKPAEQINKIYFCHKFRKYPVTSDFRNIIGLRDTSRIYNDQPFHRRSPALVAQRTYGEMYAIQNNLGVTYLDIIHSRSSSSFSALTDCESLTEDGAWTAGSGVNNIALNSTTKHEGSNSVGFDVSGATAEISFLKTTGIDASAFTEHQGFGAFLWLPTAPSQITIKWGSSASNYYQKTITIQSSGEPFITTDENEIRCDRNEATETGSVDDSSIKYFSITLTFSSSITDTDFLIDYPGVFKPEILEQEYYSKYLAQNNAGTFISKITESSSTTDRPLIFDDYLPTVLEGLGWMHFRKKDKDLAKQYYDNYIAQHAPSGALVGGKRWLEKKYPNREQHIRREIRLPSLYG